MPQSEHSRPAAPGREATVGGVFQYTVADRPKSGRSSRFIRYRIANSMIGIAQVARLFVTCYVIRHDPHCSGKLARNTENHGR
jgi:hypothetical protein